MTNAKVILLALLLLAGMIVSPVCARYEISPQPLSGDMITTPDKVTDLTVDVSIEGKAFHKITVDLGTGTSVNFTLWYGNGDTVSGWMVYTNDGFFQQHSETAIGTDVSTFDYVGLQEIGRIDVVGYARNYTTDTEYTSGFIVYDTVYGLTQFNAMAYYHVGVNVSDNVIYKFQLTSNQPVSVTYYSDTRSNVGNWANTTPGGIVSGWLALATQYATAIYDFIAGVFWILKFFFIDNLLLIIALWVSVSMAYSAISSRDVFQFYTKFFRIQRALLDFIVSLWQTLVSIIHQMVQIFVKWL
ncbi:MAG: hypothetical protein MUO73_04000 [Thermoplasmata archaeon]|nr:hypothetical protein [Thermoplasmata archaeon]